MDLAISSGNIWIIFGLTCISIIFWYNKRAKESEAAAVSLRNIIQKSNEKIYSVEVDNWETTHAEIEKRKLYEEKRLKAVAKLQIAYQKLSYMKAEKKRKKLVEELGKRLATIEYLNSVTQNENNVVIPETKSDGEDILLPVPSTTTSTSTTTNKHSTYEPVIHHQHLRPREPEQDFISDFEFEYNTMYGRGTSIRNLNCNAGINGIIREVCIDTGATYTVINERLARSGTLQRIPSYIRLIGASGERMELLGAMKITISIGNGFVVEHNALVSVNLPTNLLLGCDFHSRHGLQLDFSTNTLKFGNGSAVEFNVN